MNRIYTLAEFGRKEDNRAKIPERREKFFKKVLKKDYEPYEPNHGRDPIREERRRQRHNRNVYRNIREGVIHRKRVNRQYDLENTTNSSSKTPTTMSSLEAKKKANSARVSNARNEFYKKSLGESYKSPEYIEKAFRKSGDSLKDGEAAALASDDNRNLYRHKKSIERQKRRAAKKGYDNIKVSPPKPSTNVPKTPTTMGSVSKGVKSATGSGGGGKGLAIAGLAGAGLLATGLGIAAVKRHRKRKAEKRKM